MPKHVGVDIHHELYFMIYILLYLIECIWWLIYWTCISCSSCNW